MEEAKFELAAEAGEAACAISRLSNSIWASSGLKVHSLAAASQLFDFGD